MNYTKFIDRNPTEYGSMTNTKGQQITFYEHPVYGEDAPVVCVCHELELAESSTFYETDDMNAEHGEYEPWFDSEGMLCIGDLGRARD